MVVEIYLFFYVREILNDSSRGEASFKVFDIVLDYFGFVCDGEVKRIVAQTEL